MADVQLEDRIPFYPSQDEEHFQSLVSGLKEFADLPSIPNEALPERAHGFRHQELVKRFMLIYDRLFVFHKTGTGKSLTGVLSGEFAMTKMAADVSEMLLADAHTSIKKTLIIAKGKLLGEQFKREIVCKGTSRGTYETKEVLESDTNTMQTARINRLLREKYEFTQYQEFANKLEKLTEAEIEEAYSDTFIILDEIQNLRNSVEKETNTAARNRAEVKAAGKRKQLLRLIKHAKRIKVLVLSATPMIKDPKELAMVMNLVYPHAEERMVLPKTFDSDNWTLATMEPYLRGRVSAVRELDTGVTTKYMGVPIEGTFETLAPVEMSKLQREVYDSLPDKGPKTNFWLKHRQVLTFVFPNGKFTEAEGFDQYISRQGGDKYVANPELMSYISRRTGKRNLSDLSPGFQATIDVCKANPTKNCFIYNEFVTGPGAITLGLCLEAQGYTRFTTQHSIFEQPDKSKVKPYCQSENVSDLPIRADFKRGVPRFAIITQRTPQSLIDNILTVFNSYQNRHGDLIQVLIGSKKTREGLSLNNVMIGNMMNGFWAVPHGYQAESRMLRATSQIDLVNERQDEIIGYALSNGEGSHQQILTLHQYYLALLGETEPRYLEDYETMIGAYGEMEHIHASGNVGSERLINTNEMVRLFKQIRQLEERMGGNPDISRDRDPHAITQIGNQVKGTYGIRKYISDNPLSDDEKTSKVLELTGSLRVGADLISQWLQQNQGLIPPAEYEQMRLSLANGSFKTTGSRLADRNRMRNTIKDAYRKIIAEITEFVDRISSVDQTEEVMAYINTMRQLLFDYRDPDDATVEVEIYKRVTVYNSDQPLPQGKDQFDTRDVTIYKYAEDFDRVVRRVERIVKQVAFDARIHKNRNMIKNPDKNYTPACDYQTCEYDTSDPEPLTIYIYADRWIKLYDRAIVTEEGVKIYDGLKWLPLDVSESKVLHGKREDYPVAELNDLLLASDEDAIDRTNYDILYSSREIDEIVQKILAIFSSRNRMTYTQLYSEMPSRPQRYVLEAVIKIIDNKMPVYNRFGVVNYMNADNDTIFINPDYPHNPFYTENILGLGYYSQHLHGVKSMKLVDIAKSIKGTPTGEIHRRFMSMPVNQEFYDELEKLDSATRSGLLEEAIDMMLSGEQSEQNKAILQRFNNQYYFVRSPEYALNQIRKLKMDRLAGRGRNPKPGSKADVGRKDFVNDDYIVYAERKGTQYILGSLIHEDVPYLNYATIKDGKVSEIAPEMSNRILVLHIGRVITENDNTSGIPSRLLKASSDLRVRDQTGDTLWRDVRGDELEIYSIVLRLEINRRFLAYRDLPYYGLVTLGNVLRIVRGNGEDVQDTKNSKNLCTSVVGGSATKANIFIELDPDFEKFPDIFTNIPADLDNALRGRNVDPTGMSYKEKVINLIVRRDNLDMQFCNQLRSILYRKSIDEGRPYIIQF